jgi:hypothetical protein
MTPAKGASSGGTACANSSSPTAVALPVARCTYKIKAVVAIVSQSGLMVWAASSLAKPGDRRTSPNAARPNCGTPIRLAGERLCGRGASRCSPRAESGQMVIFGSVLDASCAAKLVSSANIRRVSPAAGRAVGCWKVGACRQSR